MAETESDNSRFAAGSAGPSTAEHGDTAPVPHTQVPESSSKAPGMPWSRGGRRFELIWLLAAFVLLAILSFLFPPNGDDWAWGSQIGIHRLDTFFADYNGRYAGNLVILALTRLPIVAPLVVAATLTAILFLILDISDNRTPWGYAITSALLLAMPVAMWNQTVSWLSGFANYTTSTMLLLIFIKAVQMDWRGRLSPSRTGIRVAGVVVFAFVSALFMENVTLFFVVGSIAIAIFRKRARGRVSADAWGWVVGFLLGAIAMFSNGAYRRAFGGGSQYQQVTGLRGVAASLLDIISRFAVVENRALNVALAVAIVLLGALTARRVGWNRVWAPVLFAVAFIACAVSLETAEAGTTVASLWRKVGGLAALLLFAALCTIAVVVSKKRRPLLLGCVAAAVVLNVPLGAVSPIGPRLFLVTYVLLLVMVNVLFQEVAEQVGHVAMVGLTALGTTLTAGLLCSYFVVYATISIASWHRLDVIRQQVAAGAQEVVVQKLPFPDYVHLPDPKEGLWAKRYKLYYDLPSNLTIKLSNHR